jgi:hypothetical protein
LTPAQTIIVEQINGGGKAVIPIAEGMALYRLSLEWS